MGCWSWLEVGSGCESIQISFPLLGVYSFCEISCQDTLVCYNCGYAYIQGRPTVLAIFDETEFLV